MPSDWASSLTDVCPLRELIALNIGITVIATMSKWILFLGYTVAGSIHDYTLFKQEFPIDGDQVGQKPDQHRLEAGNQKDRCEDQRLNMSC